MKGRFVVVVILALTLGAAIGWIDSRPGWDDTGITAVTLFLAGGLCGFLLPRWPWVCGIAVGIWVPLFEFRSDPAPLVALVLAIAGAYSGALLSRLVRGPRET